MIRKVRTGKISTVVFSLCFLGILAGSVFAESSPVGLIPLPEDADNVVRVPSYSPYAGRNFPTQVYWGDTHVHTDMSLDANGFGARIGPDAAYRLARGEEVVSSTGIPFKLSRPLDWLVVADHSDGMGAMKEIMAGNPRLLKDPIVRKWQQPAPQCAVSRRWRCRPPDGSLYRC